ncbi:MAG: alanine racemase [Spirochaetia bacterium]|nr:alanine racemase [Spirochaetia bacterium]
MLNWIEINKNAYLNNVSVFRKLHPDSLFMAVIKSNAYGHGLKESAEILRGQADWFGVNSIAEALILRDFDQKTPILVMGMEDPLHYSLLKEKKSQGIRLVLSTKDSVEDLLKTSPETPFHIKVDTGMSRLGLHGRELEDLFQYLKNNPDLPWEGLMSHFANVEDVTDQNFAQEQLRRFLEAKKLAMESAGNRNIISHIAASAAAIILPESRMDMCRIGISLYGFWPSRQTRISASSLYKNLPELMPVLSWKSRIVHLNQIPANSFVGYGCTERVFRDTLVAVIPAGYFEGYDRSLSSRSHILVKGMRARILGRVCMNMIMADVSHIDGVKHGDEAVLIGRQNEEEISADELADHARTINYEIVSRIQCDIPRKIV